MWFDLSFLLKQSKRKIKSEAEWRKSAGGADKKQQIQILYIKSHILKTALSSAGYLTVIEIIIKYETVFFLFFPRHVETGVEAVIFNGLGLAGEKKCYHLMSYDWKEFIKHTSKTSLTVHINLK